MPVAAEGRQRNVFRPAARANESLGHLARQSRREKRVVGRIEPQRGNAGARTIARGRVDQAVRRAVAGLRMPAASTAGEIDDGKHAGRLLARGRERSPTASRPADQENTIALHFGATAEIVDRRPDVLGCGQPGAIVVGAAARSEVFQPRAASLPIAAAERQPDHVSTRKQPIRYRGKRRYLHAGALGGIGGRTMADDGKRERPRPRRSKHPRLQRAAARGRKPDNLLGGRFDRCRRRGIRRQRDDRKRGQHAEDGNAQKTNVR